MGCFEDFTLYFNLKINLSILILMLLISFSKTKSGIAKQKMVWDDNVALKTQFVKTKQGNKVKSRI